MQVLSEALEVRTSTQELEEEENMAFSSSRDPSGARDHREAIFFFLSLIIPYVIPSRRPSWVFTAPLLSPSEPPPLSSQNTLLEPLLGHLSPFLLDHSHTHTGHAKVSILVVFASLESLTSCLAQRGVIYICWPVDGSVVQEC